MLSKLKGNSHFRFGRWRIGHLVIKTTCWFLALKADTSWSTTIVSVSWIVYEYGLVNVKYYKRQPWENNEWMASKENTCMPKLQDIGNVLWQWLYFLLTDVIARFYWHVIMSGLQHMCIYLINVKKGNFTAGWKLSLGKTWHRWP